MNSMQSAICDVLNHVFTCVNKSDRCITCRRTSFDGKYLCI